MRDSIKTTLSRKRKAALAVFGRDSTRIALSQVTSEGDEAKEVQIVVKVP
jgi:hypothetical protein